MRKILLASALVACVSACAAIQSAQTGKPIDPAQVKQDLAVTKQVVDTADCVVATAAPVASAIGSAVGNSDAVDAANSAASISRPLCAQPVSAAP